MTPTDFTRDRWDRPLILPRGGDKKIGYTRATTFAGTFEDQFGLTKWKVRQAMKGLVDRPDLQLAVSAHRDDNRELDKLGEKAMEASGSGASATSGTAIHLLSEKVDRGEPLPYLAPEVLADLEAYRRAMYGFTIAAIEIRTACDELQAAGTADRIVELGGERYIFDLKTGSGIDLGIGKICQQLAIYSRAWAYDIVTDVQTQLNVSQEWGIVCHLAAGSADAKMYWLDLNRGWEMALLSARVRDARKIKMKQIAFSMHSELEAAA